MVYKLHICYLQKDRIQTVAGKSIENNWSAFHRIFVFAEIGFYADWIAFNLAFKNKALKKFCILLTLYSKCDWHFISFLKHHISDTKQKMLLLSNVAMLNSGTDLHHFSVRKKHQGFPNFSELGITAPTVIACDWPTTTQTNLLQTSLSLHQSNLREHSDGQILAVQKSSVCPTLLPRPAWCRSASAETSTVEARPEHWACLDDRLGCLSSTWSSPTWAQSIFPCLCGCRGISRTRLLLPSLDGNLPGWRRCTLFHWNMSRAAFLDWEFHERSARSCKCPALCANGRTFCEGVLARRTPRWFEGFAQQQ